MHIINVNRLYRRQGCDWYAVTVKETCDPRDSKVNHANLDRGGRWTCKRSFIVPDDDPCLEGRI